MRVMLWKNIVLDVTEKTVKVSRLERNTDAGDNVVLNGTDSDSSNAGEDLLADTDSRWR